MGQTQKGEKELPLSVLWNSEWGIPQDHLSADEAKKRGLALVERRWAPEQETEPIREVLRARRRIRVGAVTAFFVPMLPAACIVPYLFGHGRPGIAPASLTVLLGFAVLWVLALFVLTQYRYAAWAFVNTISLVTLVVGAVIGLVLGTSDLPSSLRQGLSLRLYCVPRPGLRCTYSKPTRSTAYSSKSERLLLITCLGSVFRP